MSRDYLVSYNLGGTIGSCTISSSGAIRARDLDAVRAEVRRLCDLKADATVVLLAISPLADAEPVEEVQP